jgi:hypothetical protein
MHFVIPNSFRNLIEKLKQVQLDKNRFFENLFLIFYLAKFNLKLKKFKSELEILDFL